ncbi:hypothetical protein [Campylobacter curvus]|uniref:hypothetical protein n=1 Tax=Campylobacter curvus TaxID=200 RepID=UPI0014706CA8|nr:hypothetical protein [Campylobacter curvus]
MSKRPNNCLSICDKNAMIKGSRADFSPRHYYINADGFIACRLGGAVVDVSQSKYERDIGEIKHLLAHIEDHK